MSGDECSSRTCGGVRSYTQKPEARCSAVAPEQPTARNLPLEAMVSESSGAEERPLPIGSMVRTCQLWASYRPCV